MTVTPAIPRIFLAGVHLSAALLPPRTIVILSDSIVHGAGDESGRIAAGARHELDINGARRRNSSSPRRSVHARHCATRGRDHHASIGGDDLFGDVPSRLLAVAAPRFAECRTALRVGTLRDANASARVSISACKPVSHVVANVMIATAPATSARFMNCDTREPRLCCGRVRAVHCSVVVHARQRRAAAGIISRHSGHCFIGSAAGAGAGLTSERTMRNVTNAMMMKSMTTPRKCP